MTQSYKIFISANQKELKEERLAIKDIILNSTGLEGYFNVFLFEDLPAKGKSPETTYLKHVENSDIYIGIFGNNYGIKGKSGISATEREFKRFVEKNPNGEILIFIKGKDDSKRDKDIEKLIKHAKESYIYKRFLNIDELKTQILNSLITYLGDKGKLSKLPFDERVCPEAEYKDLDENEVKEYLKNRAIKLKVAVPMITITDFLVRTLKVVQDSNGILRPTNTGLLFFGKNPSEFISQHEIRIARFKGLDRIEFLDSQEITGTIYRMLDQVEAFFKRNTRLANKIVEFKRIDIPEYPYEAIREAVINAIAHRDYTQQGAPIIISMFDDRVEVSNPGALLPGLNIKDLAGHHKTRNKIICSIFHETKDMERFGTGIKKMNLLMKEHGLSVPQFVEEGDFFVARFYGPGDKILDLVPSIPKNRVTDLREIGLNERQIEGLKLMVNEQKSITIEQYTKMFKITDKTARVDLKELMDKNFISKVGSTKGAYFQAKKELPK